MTIGGVFLLPLLGGTVEAEPALEGLTSPGDLGVAEAGEGLEPSPVEAKSYEETDQGSFLQALLAATAQVASAGVVQEVPPRPDGPAPPSPVAETNPERAPLLPWSGPLLPPVGEANVPPRVSGEGRPPEGVRIDPAGARGSAQDVGRATAPSAHGASGGRPQLSPVDLQEGDVFPAEAGEPTPEISPPVASRVNVGPIPAGDQEQTPSPPFDGTTVSRTGGVDGPEAREVPGGEPPVPPHRREFEPPQPSSGEPLGGVEQAKPRKPEKGQGIALEEPPVPLMQDGILPGAQAQPSVSGGGQERPFDSGVRETPGRASDPVLGAGPPPQGGERGHGWSVQPSPSPPPEPLPEGDPPVMPPTPTPRQEVPDPSPSLEERGSMAGPEVDGWEDPFGELLQQPSLDPPASQANQAEGGQGAGEPAIEARGEVPLGSKPTERPTEGEEAPPPKRARRDSLDGSPAHHDGKVISREEGGQRPSVHTGNDLPEAPEKVDYAALRSRGERTEVLLHLRPRHLGEVEMRVEGRYRDVSAEILAERPPTVDLVRAAVPHLRQSLEEQGIHVQAFEVALASGREGGGGGAHHQQPREQAVPWFEPFGPGAEEPIPSKASWRDGRIDLIV